MQPCFFGDNYLTRIVTDLIAQCLFVMLAVIFLKCTERAKRLTLHLYVKTQQVFISLSLALWVFTLFRLHFALILWVIAYLLLCVLNKDWKIQNSTPNTKAKTYHAIYSPFDLSSYGFWEKFRVLQNSKKTTKKAFDDNHKIPLLRKTFPASIYSMGLLIPALHAIILGNQYASTDHILLILSEAYLLPLAFLGIAYPLIHFITVKNEAHLYYGNETLFKVLYTIFSLVILAIITAITLNF